MIESNNPEIDVSKLMERVRAEALKARPRENGSESGSPRKRRVVAPHLPRLAAPPGVGLSKPFDPKKERLVGALQKARRMITVGSWVPKMFRGLFRRQGGFNRVALESLEMLVKNQLQLSARVHELTIVAGQQSQWIRSHLVELDNQFGTLQSEVSRLVELDNQFGALQSEVSRLVELDNQFGALQSEVSRLVELDNQFGALQSEVSRLSELDNQFGVLQSETNLLKEGLRERDGRAERESEHLRNLQGKTDQQEALLRGTREDQARQDGYLRHLRDELNRAGEHLRNLQGEAMRALAEHVKLEANLNPMTQMLSRLEERQANDAIYLKSELSRHSSLLQRVSRGKGHAQRETSNLPSDSSEADPHRLDSLYLSFENRFRGQRSEIKDRVRFYLPFLKQAGAGQARRPILDLGCGRGEWLELLQENELEASGVDLNEAMVAQCQQRRLAAQKDDALTHLRALADDTLGAVTGFHIIEHLPLETLMDLLIETRRVLRPGGLAIFESPNCKNLMVGASNFNVDPTHRNPIFPETAQFLLETIGFDGVQLEYLSPATDNPFRGDDKNIEILGKLLYGPQDFAVIGRKSKAK